jgi:hypothetical protein
LQIGKHLRQAILISHPTWQGGCALVQKAEVALTPGEGSKCLADLIDHCRNVNRTNVEVELTCLCLGKRQNIIHKRTKAVGFRSHHG